jgi:lysophospholipase L1-like esterase
VTFQAYAALGDSMSIDRYPDLDYAGREPMRPPARGLGAASLLARNDDTLWPEFVRRDLASLHPGIEAHFLAEDGATTETVIASQLDGLDALESEAETLVTLTAGGNDLLGLIGTSPGEGNDRLRQVLVNLDGIVSAVRDHLPRATILAANVYDPTDGTGELEGTRLAAREMKWLADYNAGVARVCAARGARIVDLHRHFLGHGRSVPAPQRWYWTGSLIEPGLVGASEIRRLWLAALEART